jgi:hypothetical protein
MKNYLSREITRGQDLTRNSWYLIFCTNVITNNNIDAILITKVSDEDTVLVEITQGKWKLIAATMYFDIENQIENNFTKTDEITRYAKGGKLLIAVDTNSRTKTWHDINTNSQGRKFEEFPVNRNLHLINEKK